MFFEEDDYVQYLSLATELLDHSDLSVWAYCLMPNHIHAIVVPGEKVGLAKFFAPLHRRYARLTNKKHDWRGHLWQERFYSVVMDEAHTVAAMRYVEMNPVRAGLCDSPHEWRWSSARGNLGYVSDALLDESAASTLIRNWSEYLGVEEDECELDDLRRLTRTGRPDGDEAFVESIELKSGRVVRKQRGPRK